MTDEQLIQAIHDDTLADDQFNDLIRRALRRPGARRQAMKAVSDRLDSLMKDQRQAIARVLKSSRKLRGMS